jgi:hypothetical protein
MTRDFQAVEAASQFCQNAPTGRVFGAVGLKLNTKVFAMPPHRSRVTLAP